MRLWTYICLHARPNIEETRCVLLPQGLGAVSYCVTYIPHSALRLVHTWSQLPSTVLVVVCRWLQCLLATHIQTYLLVPPMITWLLELSTRDNCARLWEVENTCVSSVSMAPGSKDWCFHQSTVRILLLLRIRRRRRAERLRKRRRRFWVRPMLLQRHKQGQFQNLITELASDNWEYYFRCVGYHELI